MNKPKKDVVAAIAEAHKNKQKHHEEASFKTISEDVANLKNSVELSTSGVEYDVSQVDASLTLLHKKVNTLTELLVQLVELVKTSS